MRIGADYFSVITIAVAPIIASGNFSFVALLMAIVSFSIAVFMDIIGTICKIFSIELFPKPGWFWEKLLKKRS
jgi:hypothetical protein